MPSPSFLQLLKDKKVILFCAPYMEFIPLQIMLLQNLSLQSTRKWNIHFLNENNEKPLIQNLTLLKTINLILFKKKMFSIARTVSSNWKSEILRKLWFFNPSYFHNVNEEQISFKRQLCISTRCSGKKSFLRTLKQIY